MTPNSPPSLPTLKQRVLRAGGWSLAGYGLSQVIRLCSILIMTRLLVPEMFGVMAVAQVFMFGLALFSDLGLAQNTIQSRRGDEPLFLNTAWAVQILRGALMWLLALLLGLALDIAGRIGLLPLGTAYADPLLPAVVAVLSFTALIGGFESTKIGVARRKLSFAGLTKIDLAAQLAAICGMVLWASLDRSIWALVAGGIIGSAVRTVLSHAALPGPGNRWQWENKSFWEIFTFGKWIFLTSILGFLVMSSDRLLLGGLVSSEVLGVYSIAFLVVSAFSNALSRIIGSVGLPAFSEVARESPSRLRETYYRFRMPIDCAALSLAGFLFSAGSLIIRILFDVRYEDAGPILEILALLLVMTRYDVVDQCYLALGRPKLTIPVEIVHIAGMYLLVPVVFHLSGFSGAIWAIVIASFVGLPVVIWMKAGVGLLDVRKELLVLPVFLIGMAAGVLLDSVVTRWILQS